MSIGGQFTKLILRLTHEKHNLLIHHHNIMSFSVLPVKSCSLYTDSGGAQQIIQGTHAGWWDPF